MITSGMQTGQFLMGSPGERRFPELPNAAHALDCGILSCCHIERPWPAAGDVRRTLCVIAFILGLALIGLVGCARSQAHRASFSADSWYYPPTEWQRFRQGQPLVDADIIEVSPDHMPAAEEQLRDLACVEISPGRATELTGRAIASRMGRSLFLVRAVYLNRGTGKFEVTPIGSELLVEHGSLGHSAVPMKRQALVVRLSQKPETVFISCSMDE